MSGRSLNFASISRLEPQLQQLYESLPRRVERSKTKRDDFWWLWANVKREFSKLVGWDATNVYLASPLCYDIVYDKFYDRLNELWPELEN